MDRNHIPEHKIRCISRISVYRLVALLRDNEVWEEYRKECAKYHKLASDRDCDVIRYLMIASYITYYAILPPHYDNHKELIDDYEALSWLMVLKFSLYSTSFDWVKTKKGREFWFNLSAKNMSTVPDYMEDKLIDKYNHYSYGTIKIVNERKNIGRFHNVCLFKA